MEENKKTGAVLVSVSRRKAVKTIVGGVSALAAYNMLPVRWEKPIIEQVFLPAHAQTSGVLPEDPPAEQPPDTEPPVDNTISSSPASVSAPNDTSDTGDDIWITFDGVANLALILQTGGPRPADGVVGIDTDPGEGSTWDAYASGANWIVDDQDYGASDNTGGPYFVVVNDGGGNAFRIQFTVTLDGNTPPTATVDSVTAQPVT